jgi:hypothetical protein
VTTRTGFEDKTYDHLARGYASANINVDSRIGAYSAFSFVLLLFATVAIVNIPHDATDSELISWWSKSSNLNASLISSFLSLATAVALLFFLIALRHRLNPDRASDSTSVQVMYSSGVIGVGLLIVSRLGIGVIASAVKMDDQPLPGVDLLRYLPQFGYVAMTSVLCILSISMISGALANRITAGFGHWWTFTTAGLGLVVLGGATLIGPFIIPVLLLWTVITGIGLWKTPARQSDASI